jgi:hypothetical protein
MFKLYSIDYDQRLRAFCANVTSSYEWYLNATAGAEHNLTIQRKIISESKAYATLRQDIRAGCILPPIVLAIDVPKDRTTDILGSYLLETQDFFNSLELTISDVNPRNVSIIDGLQRTNALRQVRSILDPSEIPIFMARHLRLELWLNISFSALAYRMLLLNAGQRPMSIKHQVEILSQNLKSDLEDIPFIEIIDAGRRRVRPRQFQLSKLSLAFQAWLQGNPNVDVRNTVVEQMLADSAVETLGTTLDPTAQSQDNETFKKLISWLVFIDHHLGVEYLEFFGNETVLQGFCAAVGAAQRNEQLSLRVDHCLQTLQQAAFAYGPAALGVEMFEKIRKGIDPSRKNVGEATRSIVYTAFQEYFVSNALKQMDECWNFAGARQ